MALLGWGKVRLRSRIRGPWMKEPMGSLHGML